MSVRHPADQTGAHYCQTSSLKASATGNHAKQPISTEFFDSLNPKRPFQATNYRRVFAGVIRLPPLPLRERCSLQP